MKLKVIGTLAYDSVETSYGIKSKQLGGSAVYFSLSASYLCDYTSVTGVIGRDFNNQDLECLLKRGIKLDGIHKSKIDTFRWEGRYNPNSPNEAITITTQLNALESYSPELFHSSEDPKETFSLFLANYDPNEQLKLIEQIPSSVKIIGLDTMDFWIKNHIEVLHKIFPKIDVLIINEGELKLISKTTSMKKSIDSLFKLGIKRAVIKLGNYGLLYFSETSNFFLPSVPLDDVKDPTGAGDSFAGGFMGYLSTVENVSETDYKKACVEGSAMASFCVEEFGVLGLLNLNKQQINRRKKILVDSIKI